MEDLFEREQSVLNDAMLRVKSGTACSIEEYTELTKEYHRLLKQLRRFTKISDKTTVELNASKLNLLDKVHVDELTGINNRRFFDENMHQILHEMAQFGGTLSVMMIDVDFFKRYNDTYGHDKGDECLWAIAQAVSGSVTGEDAFAARYGGEEFIVVLPNTREANAQAIADQILNNIRACSIAHEKNEVSNCVTVSIGVTTGRVQHAHTITDYVKASDKALYRSKKNGRNQSTFIQLKEASINDV